MKAHMLIISVVITSFLVIAASPATAETRAELADRNLAQQADTVASMNELKSTMQSKSSEDWTILEVQTYLNYALWDVYLGAAAYVYDNRVAAQDSSTLINNGYVSEWPENPFNEWEPMELNTISTEFVAGDLCLMICPYDFYSGYNVLVPRCFEMCVFGPTVEFADSFGDAKTNKLNTWAAVPNGAMYQLGYYTTTHDQLLAAMSEGKEGEE